MTPSVYFAYEDVVHREILKKILEYLKLDINVVNMRETHGREQLKSDMPKYNNIAYNGLTCVVLADLDRGCPVDLLNAWLTGIRKSDNLILRFAVMEAEAWLLADYKCISEYLRVDETLITRLGLPDRILDPKGAIMKIAEKSRLKDLRDDIVSDNLSYRRVGQGYNYRMQELISFHWDVKRAAHSSESLDRFISAMRSHSWV
jgi:hypothetical protein